MTAQPAATTVAAPHRTPMWLTADERADLTAAIENLLTVARVFPTTEKHLRAVLLELEVTSARDRLWPTQVATVRAVAGYSPDTVAVRLSADERTALATVPNLPAAVTAALT